MTLSISDIDIFPNPEFPNRDAYEKRVTVKAIVCNQENKIGLVINDVHNIYTLPGGGAESEDLIKEIERECVEEIQAIITNTKELVRIQEKRNREGKEYETICFTATVSSFISEDLRTEEERVNGVRVEWISVEDVDAIFEQQNQQLQKGKITFYNTAFNVYRDAAFWKEYRLL